MNELRMIYSNNVCKFGEVIIDHVRHKVVNGWVKCNDSLNRSAWNTTEETSYCLKCFRHSKQTRIRFNEDNIVSTKYPKKQ